MAGNRTIALSICDDLLDALAKTITLVEWPGDVHEVSVYVKTKEGGLVGHSIVPFVFINTQGLMGPCVAAGEAEEKVG